MISASAIADAVAHYGNEGYAVLRGMFDAAEIAAIGEAFDRHWREGMTHRASFRHGNLFYRLGQDARLGRVLRMVQWPSYADARLEQVRRDPRWLAVLEPLIGRDIKQIINQLHWKPPGGAGAEFAFHQDARFRRPREAFRNLATSYVQTGIAVDRHRAANGALQIYPGSHRFGAMELAGPGPVVDQALAEARLSAAGLDPKKLVTLELDPGDVALWNVYTIHGSGPNHTESDRRFYLNGYVRAADCDRGEWAFRDGVPCPLGEPVLVHYDALHDRPEPHYVEE